ncbi:hypothetical protein WN943_015622 [Citrus x changshan-huyou]
MANYLHPRQTADSAQSTTNRRLNEVSPLENLRHVKRIQKKFLEGGCK